MIVKLLHHSSNESTVLRLDKRTFAKLRNPPSHGVWNEDLRVLLREILHDHDDIKPTNVYISSGRADSDWLESFGFLIPKELREPWLGDLRQDRKRMADEGCNRFFIACATASQFVCAAVAVARGFIKDAVSGLLRMS